MLVQGYMILSIKFGYRTERLFALANGKVLEQPEREFSTSFPKSGWTPSAIPVIPAAAQYIGEYVING